LRLLHLIHSANPKGGGPIEGVRQLGAANQRLGHRVEVACLDAPEAPWLKEFPLPLQALGPGLGKYGFVRTLGAWLRQKAANNETDAIIVNGIWQYHSLAAWQVLRRGKIPYFVFTHGMLDPWFKKHYPLKHLKKWLYWPWADYRVLRDARAVLFTSEEERRLARQSFWLYRCNERVVSCGAPEPPADEDKQRSAFFEKCPGLSDRRIILFLGRLHEKKGCDLLLRAFASVAVVHPQLHLVMAGPGQQGEMRQWQNLARELGITDRVSWPGMLTGPAKWGAFRAAEVFALPSHQENFGIAVAESLACGTPVLISRAVNIFREVTACQAGFAEPDTQEGACRLLERWLALAPAARLAMRQNSRRCFEQHFEINNAAQNLIKTLRDCGVNNP